MKQLVLLITVSVLMFSNVSFAESKRNNIEITGGVFSPGSDYDDYAGWDNGGAFTLNYIREFNSFLAFETGISTYRTEMEDGWYLFGLGADGEVKATGLEVLGRLYYKFSGLRLYVSGGLGYYHTDLELKSGGSKVYGDDGFGLGYVAKAGFDYIFNNGLYLGLNVKHFTNEHEFDDFDEKVDFGGTVYGLTAGYNF